MTIEYLGSAAKDTALQGRQGIRHTTVGYLRTISGDWVECERMLTLEVKAQKSQAQDQVSGQLETEAEE
jgi:hypothetical protein